MQEMRNTRDLGIWRARAADKLHLIAGCTCINTQLSHIKSSVAQHEWHRPVHQTTFITTFLQTPYRSNCAGWYYQ